MSLTEYYQPSSNYPRKTNLVRLDLLPGAANCRAGFVDAGFADVQVDDPHVIGTLKGNLLNEPLKERVEEPLKELLKEPLKERTLKGNLFKKPLKEPLSEPL